MSFHAAVAGINNLNIISRTGWRYLDHDLEKTGLPSSSSFDVDYLKTNFSGTLNPTVKYLVTMDLLESSGNKDVTDGTSSFIYEAYMTKSFSQGTTVAFGKKAVINGGREYDYVEYDLYSTSYFYQSAPENQVGITITQEFGDQSVAFQLFNGNKDKDAGANPIRNSQSKMGYSLSWNGNFLGGIIKPILGYSIVPEASGFTYFDGQRHNKGDDEFAAVGVQLITPHNVVIELDYDQFVAKQAGTNRENLMTTSMVGQLRFTGENFFPFVKIISDKKKIDSTKMTERMAFDVGFEYQESKEDAFRYHVVYSGESLNDLSRSPNVKSNPQSIFIGLKFDAAVLK